MKNIFKLFLLLMVTNVNANSQKPLEYTALIERGCPLNGDEFEDMIEAILHNESITPLKVKKANRKVIHLNVHMKCERLSIIKNKYTLTQKVTSSTGLLDHPQIWVIKNKSGTKPYQNRDIVKARIIDEVKDFVRSRFSRN